MYKPTVDNLKFPQTIKSAFKKIGGMGITGAKYYLRAGEYDLVIDISSKESAAFLQCFRCGDSKNGIEPGIFNASSNFYKKYIYQTRTEWLLRIPDRKLAHKQRNFSVPCMIKLTTIDVGLDAGEPRSVPDAKEDNPVVNVYKYLRERSDAPDINLLENRIAKYLYDDEYITDVLKMLASEYRHIIRTDLSMEWRGLIREQFAAFEKCVINALKGIDCRGDYPFVSKPVADYYVKEIISMIDILRHTLQLLTRANHRTIDHPRINLPYIGSNMKILHAYYGYICWLFSVGARLPHAKGTDQSDVAFTVYFHGEREVTSIAHFPLWNDIVGKRFVSILLPYAAMNEFPKYMGYLAHEVFHYVAPPDRRDRNRKLFQIALDMLYTSFITYALTCIAEPHSNDAEFSMAESNSSMQCVYKHILDTFLPKYIQEQVNQPNNSLGYADCYDLNLKYFMNLFTDKLAQGKSDANVALIYRRMFDAMLTHILNGYDAESFADKFGADFGDDEHKHAVIKIIWNDLNAYRMIERAEPVNDPKPQDALWKQYIHRQEYTAVHSRIKDMFLGFSEATADTFAIQILGLDTPKAFVGYFKQFLQDKHVIPTMDMDTQEQYVRFGILFDTYYRIEKGRFDDRDVMYKHMYNNLISGAVDADNEFERNIVHMYCLYLQLFSLEQRCMFANSIDMLSLDSLCGKISDPTAGTTLRNELLNFQGSYSEFRRLRESYETADNDEKWRLKRELTDRTRRFLWYFQRNISINFNEDRWDAAPAAGDAAPAADASTPPSSVALFSKAAVTIGSFYELVDEEIRSIDRDLHALRPNLSPDVKIDEPIWYRGLAKTSFGCMPSLLRGMKTDKSPYMQQHSLYNAAMIQLKQFPSMLHNQVSSPADRIALMQHYGLKTLWLDFTDEPMAGLHFALNPDDEKDRYPDDEAVVCMFVPCIYLYAVKVLSNSMHGIVHDMTVPVLPSHRPLDSYLLDYLPMEYDRKSLTSKHTVWLANRSLPAPTPDNGDYLPIPVHVMLSNDRIRTQRGTFVAFSANSPAVSVNDEGSLDTSIWSFTNVDLFTVQENYRKACQENPEKVYRPFIRKVFIDRGSIVSMRRQLKELNYTTTRVYPELEKLMKDAGNYVASR
ncbi:hypothetical protein FACS1894184_05210 [Clostridia bacterium]|nr:hypothetical protein FACS1894184_05210 [Clostridia bacterium]